MVKAPSRHGLDRTYRPWRRGKGKANKQGSLKHQLRGQERLLSKLQRQNNSENETRIQALNKSIAELNAQILAKEQQEKQRENAKKAHGTRFLERQRLSRLERKARQDKDEKELLRIALDQVYVAHFPLDKSYRPLLRNGKRWLRHSVSRAQLRDTILQNLKQKKIQPVAWIAKDMYQLIPDRWSVQDEVELFQYPRMNEKDDGKDESKKEDDDRFAMQAKHDLMLKVAQELESDLAKEEGEMESSIEKEDVKPRAIDGTEANLNGDDSDSDSSDSDSSDSDSSTSSSTSGSDRGDPGGSLKDKGESVSASKNALKRKNECATTKRDDSINIHQGQDGSESEDDNFLIPAQEEDVNIFDRIRDNPNYILPAENPAKGDKSQGWATQQQRPGKYKKKRTRK